MNTEFLLHVDLTIKEIETFYTSLRKLEQEQGFYSHPFWYNLSYEDIVNMGPSIIPLIYLNLLEEDKDFGNENGFYLSGHWHAALTRLTGCEIGRNNIEKIGGFAAQNIDGLKKSWLDWIEKQDKFKKYKALEK